MFFSTKSSKDISERQAQLQTELEQTRNTIREVEARAAQALAEGSSTGADFGAVASLKAKEEATQRALAILQAEGAAAEKRERIADAKAKRKLASEKRGEAAAIVPKRDKLLAQLSALELVTYDATILSNQHVGTWNPDIRVYDARIPVDLKNGFEFGFPESGLNPSVPAGQFARSRERVLIDEACALEAEADRIDQAEGVEAVAEVAG